MNILICECSTDTALVALYTEAKTASRLTHEKGRHSRDLFTHTAGVLDECGIVKSAVDVICCGTGPGSFTGIRIAVSSMRMFAQVLSIPIIGINSQELYAASADAVEGELIVSAFDAKKGRVFGAVYRKEKGLLSVCLEPGDYFPDEIRAVTGNDSGVAVGDGSEKYEDILCGNRIILQRGFLPDAKRIAEYIMKAYAGSLHVPVDPEKVKPCYARKSDAEVLKDAKEKA